MCELTCTHHLRGPSDRAGFEYEFTIGAAHRVTFYHTAKGWAVWRWREPVTPAQLADWAGLDEAKAAGAMLEAAAICEQEYLRTARPARPALRAVA